MTGRLKDRIALITGASRGIGAEVAHRFALEGAHVVLVARTRGGLEDVDDRIRAELKIAPDEDSPVTLLELDLTDLDAVDRIGPTIAQRFGKLDIVVGNAGLLGEMSPMHHIATDVWTEVVDVNLNANWRLIRTTDPLLRQSDAGRAVFVTSGAAHGKRPYWGAYAVTKAALEMMVSCWAAETEKTAMRINLMDPGATRTTMRADAYPGEDPSTVKPPEDIAGAFIQLCSPGCEQHGDLIRAY
ncbi:MAG: SDR family NAD(P)-dependent oxidoreductase [Rhodospirillaceae bacterium]|nr:MAG: SDR family NAD(P)-dependent oxidoreductase [Rhodospirillaceae bacterium]